VGGAGRNDSGVVVSSVVVISVVVGGAGRNDSGVVVSSVVVGSVVVGGAGRNDSGGGDGRQRGDSGQRLRSLTRFIQPRELVLLRHEPRV